jgi:hypothetical protein
MGVGEKAAATVTQAPDTYRFDVERRVEHVFETYVGWITVATVDDVEYDYQAINRVVAECEAPGRYRVVRYAPPFMHLSEFNVTRRTEWDVERVES